MPGEELSPSLYATLKHAASLVNPEFYDRQRRRQSTWNVPRFLRSYDETLDGQLLLPRGLLDSVVKLVSDIGSKAEIDDKRSGGSPQGFMLGTDLTVAQRATVRDVLPHDLGLIVAPPGSGKTVMACGIIAERATSTLVLVDRKTLADQWRAQIQDLLGIKPGQLGGGRSRLTGIIDVATLQTLARRDDLDEKLRAYGQVVVDECHHIPAAAFEAAVRTIPARWWLGLTATPYRRDRLDELLAFQLGPVRHTLEPGAAGTLEGAAAQRPLPSLVVHPTSFRYDGADDLSAPGAITAVYRDLAVDRHATSRSSTTPPRHCLGAATAWSLPSAPGKSIILPHGCPIWDSIRSSSREGWAREREPPP